MCAGITFTHTMPERYSIYMGKDDEELVQFIEEYGEDVFGGKSKLFKMALRHFKQDKGEMIESLKVQEDLDELT